MEMGGWVGPGLTLKQNWKIVQNNSIPVLYILRKVVVSYYDLIVLCMSVIGFKKEKNR